MRALRGRADREPAAEDFDHFGGGGPDQPITTYRDDEIVPTLSDWVVGKTLAEPAVTKLPTGTEPGEFEIPMSVQFNVHHGDIQGVVRVVYGGYLDENGELQWKIIDGADEEGHPTELRETKENSLASPVLPFVDVVELPVVDPGDRSTQLSKLAGAIVPIGPEQQVVPLEPETGFFATLSAP